MLLLKKKMEKESLLSTSLFPELARHGLSLPPKFCTQVLCVRAVAISSLLQIIISIEQQALKISEIIAQRFSFRVRLFLLYFFSAPFSDRFLSFILVSSEF